LVPTDTTWETTTPATKEEHPMNLSSKPREKDPVETVGTGRFYEGIEIRRALPFKPKPKPPVAATKQKKPVKKKG
jgi:hypothetical protein